MKHLLLLLTLTFSLCVFSQAATNVVSDDNAIVSAVDQPASSQDYSFAAVTETDIENPANPFSGIFETFFALVAFLPIAIQFLKKLIIPKVDGIWAQIFSWVIGIAITLVGWLLHFGFLDGLSFWIALLYGAGASLAANGIFDTGIIQAIFGLFGKKVTE